MLKIGGKIFLKIATWWEFGGISGGKIGGIFKFFLMKMLKMNKI